MPAARAPADRPMWTCSRCRRRFANRHQSHSCARLRCVSVHLDGKTDQVRHIVRRFIAAVRALGPVRVLPERTRIAFQVRMSFAQITPRQRWVDGHVVLARRVEHPRFRIVQTFSPRNHLHSFRLERAEDLDDTVVGWLREAYDVGAQRHLT